MNDLLTRILGWRALILQSDPLTWDRWRWVAQCSPLVAPGVKVLDAGAGNGGFSLYAAARGASVLGLSDAEADMRKAHRRAVQAGLEVDARFEVFDLRQLATDGASLGTFDVAFCLEVIEHVLDDAALLRALGERLRHGGTLLLTTPTDDHPPLHGEHAHLSGVEDGRHVRWGSSPERLREVLDAAGYEVLSIEPVSGPCSRWLTSTTYALQARIGVVPAWVLGLPLRPLRVLDPLLLRKGRASHCWGVVARRR